MRVAFLFLCAVVIPCWAQEPIAQVKAKATSMQVAKLFDPQNLCTDAGLRDVGKEHKGLLKNGYADGGSLWHSGYIALGGDEQPIVEFDLGKEYDVARFRIWNHNANPSRGFKDVAILYSLDGKSWKTVDQRFRFTKPPHQDDYIGEEHRLLRSIRARYIRFYCESTHRQGGNRELAGLGKVRFYEGKTDAAAVPEETQFPIGAGLINLKKAPYFAKGDGVTDDGPVIQKAIDDWQGSHRMLYLPPGKYLTGQSLRFKPGRGNGYNNLRGAGVDQTTLILRDNTFTDATQPNAVLTLGFNGREDGKGVHADWFNNNVCDLTIDAGSGNPGAIGLQYYSNNSGACRDIRILSRDGRGVIGLDLGYADQNGPCLIKNLHIEGFATGVRSGATVNSQTAENITIVGATKTGWINGGQCLSIRKLSVRGTGEGFVNQFGVVCLIDSEFHGSAGSAELPAISSGETLFARNIRTTGYKLAIQNNRKKDQPSPNAPGPNVEEWVSTPPLTLYPTENPRSLNLPIEETPTVDRGNPSEWANVRAFRELSDPDDTAALQRAIDSGAKTVYFPSGGTYFISQPVEIRGSVQCLIGFHSNVTAPNHKSAILRVTEKSAPRILLQELSGHLEVEHAGPGQLIARDSQGLGGKLTGGGRLYMENIVSDWEFNRGTVWARQFNNERLGLHILNAGATLWILGLKTERGGTLIETRKGGRTELLGGLCYTTNNGKLAPMFVSIDAPVSYTIGEVCYNGNPYTRFVEQRRGAESKLLDRQGVPLRPNFLQGGQLPLFVGK